MAAVTTTDTGTDRGRTSPIRPLIIDSDVHEVIGGMQELVPYLPPEWQKYITEYGFRTIATGWPHVIPVTHRKEWKHYQDSDPLATMQKYLLAQMGVSVGVINNATYHFSAMPCWHEFSAALAAAYNDWEIEHWLDREPRLRGSVNVVVHDPAVAAREIDRVGAHPQMVQVMLPVVVDRQYGDPMYRPIYEACVRNNLVVAMHHDGETRSVLHPGYGRFFVEWHAIALPSAMQAQLASFIFNGTFDRFPDLKVVGLEAGFTWLPSFMSRCDRQYAEFRVEVPWVRRKPSEHVRDSIRLATQPMEDLDARAFMNLCDLMGTDETILFSSDYPHYDTDEPAAALPPGLPESTRDRIMFRNALATYARLGVDA
jgi:predicted TIM-barrel fold metal-dependent hydrolase